MRALSGGITTDDIFDMVRKIRKRTKIPLVFMTYVNVIFSYGAERFIRIAGEIGMDGIILPDLPYEEKDEFDPLCRQYELDLISLIAPTSKERIAKITKEASGFIYCISSLRVTGVRKNIASNVGEMIELVKKTKQIPCAVGFGISTPEQAANVLQVADGVIVGSAIVRLCEEHKEDCVAYVKKYVEKMSKTAKSVLIYNKEGKRKGKQNVPNCWSE